MKQTRIAVINGGDSPEAEVSRRSAEGVIRALRENYAHVSSIELEAGVTEALAACRPDVVFPILHGPPGEDGTLQGFLEILGYRYVGSGVRSSALAMDKIIAKAVFRAAGLPVVEQCVVTRDEGAAAAVRRITGTLGDRVVVKPAGQGSAIGVTLADNANQLHAGVSGAFAFDQRLLVEKRIDGREITVGVLDTDQGARPFPVIEITTPEDSWYDYEHRYTQGLSAHLMPADLPEAQARALQDIAVRAHHALDCRDLSRADFLVSGEDVYLLEVNTLPGMTPTSLYPDGAVGYGLDFPALVSHLVERAMQRQAAYRS